MDKSALLTRLVVVALLISCAYSGRTPSLSTKEGLATARPVISPVSKEELMSFIDPLEIAKPQQCSSSFIVDNDAISNIAPYAAAGFLVDTSALAGYVCHASCDGRPFNATGEESDCWGNFRWYCKSNTSCGSVIGVKCDGHYTFYHDEDAGKAFASCEGLQKYLNVRISTCPASGITYRKFISAGCLGTSYSKMVDAPSARAAAADTAADMRAEATGVTAVPLASNSAGVLLGDQHGQLLAALHSMGSLGAGRSSSGHGGVYEGKCEGLGGEVKGVKRLSSTSTVPPMEYESVDDLDAALEAALADMGLPSPLSAATPEIAAIAASATPTQAAPLPLTAPPASLFAALLPAAKAKVALGNDRHLFCELTCNGKVPWLKGSLPCWGKLELNCEGVKANEDPDIKAPKPAGNDDAALTTEEEALEAARVREEKRKAALERQAAAAQAIDAALPLSHTGYTAVHGRKAIASAEAAFLASEFEDEGGEGAERRLLVAPQQGALGGGLRLPVLWSSSSFEFDASCTGFWTGWFGKRCFGLTSTHGMFESEEKNVEMWGLCTGKHGIAGRKGKDGYAMGSWCKGHSAKGIVVEKHTKPHTDAAMADLMPAVSTHQ